MDSVSEKRLRDLELNRGENHPEAKLTEREIREVHQLVLKGLSTRQAMKEVGVTNVGKQAVRNAIRGLSWTHLQLNPLPTDLA